MLPSAVRVQHVILPALATQVGVREQPIDLDVLGELDQGIDLEISIPGRNLEIRVHDLAGPHFLAGRRVGEDHPDPGHVTGHLAVRRVMNRKNDLRAFRDSHRGPRLEHHRIRTRRHQSDQSSRPPGKRPRFLPPRSCALGSGVLGGHSLLADRNEPECRRPRRSTRYPGKGQNVMHHRRRACTHLDRGHPLVLGEVGRHGEVLVRHLALGRHVERLCHLEHHVWRPDLPPVDECRRRGQLVEVATRGPGVDPLHDGVALGVGQPSLIPELSDRGVGVPRRHLPRQDLVLDGAAPGSRLLVGHQRHRRHLARAMAGDTVLVQDRRDVVGERRRLRLGAGCGGATEAHGHHEGSDAGNQTTQSHYTHHCGPPRPKLDSEHHATTQDRCPFHLTV